MLQRISHAGKKKQLTVCLAPGSQNSTAGPRPVYCIYLKFDFRMQVTSALPQL